MLSQGQHTAAVNLVQMGSAKYVTVAIGAIDVVLFLQNLNPANPATFDPNAAAAPDSGVFGLSMPPDDAAVVLIPVPFEATTSYGGGTADGPRCVLEASKQVDALTVFDDDHSLDIEHWLHASRLARERRSGHGWEQP